MVQLRPLGPGPCTHTVHLGNHSTYGWVTGKAGPVCIPGLPHWSSASLGLFLPWKSDSHITPYSCSCANVPILRIFPSPPGARPGLLRLHEQPLGWQRPLTPTCALSLEEAGAGRPPTARARVHLAASRTASWLEGGGPPAGLQLSEPTQGLVPAVLRACPPPLLRLRT